MDQRFHYFRRARPRVFAEGDAETSECSALLGAAVLTPHDAVVVVTIEPKLAGVCKTPQPTPQINSGIPPAIPRDLRDFEAVTQHLTADRQLFAVGQHVGRMLQDRIQAQRPE